MSTHSLPKTTAAIQIAVQSPNSELIYRDDAPLPSELKQGEILVKNEYAGLNFIDNYFRSGLYTVQLPFTLGSEAEGTIVATGPGATEEYGLKPGDRVAYVGNSAYAQYTVVDGKTAVTLPKTIKPTLGAASLLQGLTGVALLREAYTPKKGDTILIHAAAGGVGTILTQLVSRAGATVVATAGSDAKLQLAKELGATHLINYTTEDWVSKVQEVTQGKGVQAVFDGVGGAVFEGNLTVLARKGTLVTFGSASGPVEKFDLIKLGAKNLKVCRPRLFGYIETREELSSYANELIPLVGDGDLKILIHKVYGWKELDQALTDIKGRGTTGKLLLKIKP